MLGHKEEYVTAIAFQDLDAGDAIIFRYLNGAATFTTQPVVSKSVHTAGVGGKLCHGTVENDCAADDMVAVRLATAGTICVKVQWTGTLTSGQAIYPGLTTDGVLDATGDAENILGMYVGHEDIPDTRSGEAVEVLIVRLSANFYTP